MTPTPQARKGERAELEVAALLAERTGLRIERRYGEGRRVDQGDLTGAPSWCLQVKNYADPMRAAREGLDALDRQHPASGCPFAAVLVRRRGGKWLAVMSLDQFADVVRRTEGGSP